MVAANSRGIREGTSVAVEIGNALHPVENDDHLNRIPLRSVQSERPSASDHFVIRVRCEDEHSPRCGTGQAEGKGVLVAHADSSLLRA